MSLFKQLLLSICLFLFVVFTGNFLIGLDSARNQSASQLKIHAQDAATALGLTLSPYIDDAAHINKIIDSLFASGYFSRIRLIDAATEQVMTERVGLPAGHETPAWFVRLTGLNEEQGDAIVSRGWFQAARVEVVSHPLFAIERLWKNALSALGGLLICVVLCCGLGAWVLRMQLRPLEHVVAQAHAIVRREFLGTPKLPRTPELRRVMEAMNLMVEKLRALFKEEAARSERLHDEAYQDPLTGLGNGRYFDLQLRAYLSDKESPSGHLMLLRVNDLAGLNRRLGPQKADELLFHVAALLRGLDSRYEVARNRGGEFVLLASGLNRDESADLLLRLSEGLEQLFVMGSSDCQPVAFVSLMPFNAGEQAEELYRALDRAQAQATQTPGGIVWATRMRAAAIPDERQYWRGLLEQALSHEQVELHFQPVLGRGQDAETLHYKVLARLLDADGKLIPAGDFLPWLARFGWNARLDALVLRRALQHLETGAHTLAVSISGSSLRSSQTLAVLDGITPEQGRQLVIELDEAELPSQEVLEALARQLMAKYCRLGIQHFGNNFSMIGSLSRLGLAYLKIDGIYIRNIDLEPDKRLFLQALQRATHNIDLPLIAERVETAGEWQQLSELGFAGGQGYLLGAPAAWRI